MFLNFFSSRSMILSSSLLFFLFCSFAPAFPDTDSERILARINGQPVTNRDLSVMEALAPEFSRIPEEERRAALLSNFIEIQLVATEARKKGMDQDPEFKHRMDFLKQRALYATLIEKEIASKVTEQEIRGLYDKEVVSAVAPDEVRASHILVKTKKEASAVIKDLDAGKKFGDLAKKQSIDSASAVNGGDLGYFSSGSLVPEFEKAAFGLSVGKYTKKPVQTKFGFHVIHVQDKRKQPIPTFEQARSHVMAALVKKKYFEKLQELRTASTIEVVDSDLKKKVELKEKDTQARKTKKKNP